MSSENKEEVKIWDPLVRIFHWSLVFAFTAAALIEKPRDLHEALGYIVVALVAFRLIWGLIGSKHARFTDFVPGPRRFLGYFCDMISGREKRYLGHNPAGGAMIIALLFMLIIITGTGIMMGMDRYFGKEWVEELHESAFNFTLLLVALHVGGVIFESLRHRENLVLSMLTGKKRR